MKISSPRYLSPLGRMQSEPIDVDVTKRNGWQEQKILVIAETDTRLDPLERELIRKIGNRLYGIPGQGNRHG